MTQHQEIVFHIDNDFVNIIPQIFYNTKISEQEAEDFRDYIVDNFYGRTVTKVWLITMACRYFGDWGC